MYFLLLLISSWQGEGAALRWQFKQGDSFQLETRSQLQQVVKAAQQEFKQDIVHTTVVKYTVSEVAPDGSVTLDQQIDSMKATNPDGTPSSGNNAVLNQLQGAILKAKLKPALEVEQLEGYEELVKRLAGDDPSVRRVVQALLSEEQLKNSISHSLGFVPQKPALVGETWKREMTMSLGPLGSVLINQAYKFEGMENVEGVSLAKISYQPTISYISPKPEAMNPEMSIVKGTMQLKSGQGVLYFDPAKGRLQRNSLKLVLIGEMTAKVQGKEVPVTFEQTQSFEVRMMK